MWQSYFIIAFRALARTRLLSFINIFGLALGLAACILTYLFVNYETHFDTSWTDADHIYRIHGRFELPGADPVDSVATMGPLKAALLKDIPQIESAARLNALRPTIRYGDSLYVEDVAFIDAEFLSIFDIRALAGQIAAGRGDIASLIITEDFAYKYFGHENSIGKIVTLSLEGFLRDYKIAAVVANPPSNSHLIYSAFAYIDEEAFRHIPDYFERWMATTNLTYYRFAKGATSDDVDSKLAALIDLNFSEWPQAMDIPASKVIKLFSMKIKDIHLQAIGTGDLKPNGNLIMVRIFAVVAGLILFIASINFVNLSTARSTARAREVALRKVLGATRRQLITQFLVESVLITVIASVFALCFVEFSSNWFSQLLNIDLNLRTLGGGLGMQEIILFMMFVIVIGIVSGLYPAFYLSRFRPAQVLTGGRDGGGHFSSKLRQILVIIQFAVSAILMISTATIYGQMTFIHNADLGFNRDGIVLVRRLERAAAAPSVDALLTEVSRLPGVRVASLSNSAPAEEFQYLASVRRLGYEVREDPIIGYRQVDQHFLETYDISILAGRNFDIRKTTDRLPRDMANVPFALRKASVLLNKAAIRRLGFTQINEALGKTIVSSIGDETGQRQLVMLTIIGVVPDLHFTSLKKAVQPEMLIFAQTGHRILSVRYDSTLTPANIVFSIERIWRSLVPEVPFLYDHLDQILAKQYDNEARQTVFLAIFAVLSVIIACLGLFGLAAFTVERRTKEIAIRKIMGASVVDIVKLLLFQFSIPVLIANAIAWPIALIILSDWLLAFNYRIDFWFVGPILCTVVAAVSLIIAWATVGGHALQVSQSNPIHSLRTEES